MPGRFIFVGVTQTDHICDGLRAAPFDMVYHSMLWWKSE